MASSDEENLAQYRAGALFRASCPPARLALVTKSCLFVVASVDSHSCPAECGVLGTRVMSEKSPLQSPGRMALTGTLHDTFCRRASSHVTTRADLVVRVFLSDLTSNLWPSVRSFTPLVGRPFLTWSATILSKIRGISWLPCQTLWLSSLPASARGRFTSLVDIPPEVSE